MSFSPVLSAQGCPPNQSEHKRQGAADSDAVKAMILPLVHPQASSACPLEPVKNGRAFFSSEKGNAVMHCLQGSKGMTQGNG